MEAFCLLHVESQDCSTESFSSLEIAGQECLNQSGSLCFDIFSSVLDIDNFVNFVLFFSIFAILY